MLYIKTNNSDNYALEHYNNIKFYLEEVIDLYEGLFDSIDKDDISIAIKHYNECKLHGTTKNSIINKISWGNFESEFLNNLDSIIESDISYFQKAIDYLKLHLKEIITQSPEEINKINLDFKSKFNNPNNNILLDKILLNSIFNYDKFSKKNQGIPTAPKGVKWNKIGLSKLINVNTCAYCNRLYISTTDDFTTNTLDHFFDKAQNPLLALSFYNLIPSCTPCNSSMKESKKFTLENNIHPYLEGFGDNSRFTYNPSNISAIVGNNNELKIELKPISQNNNTNKKAQNNIDTFELNTLYNEHKDYVQEIIKKSTISNKKYLKILSQQTFKNLDLSIEETYQLAFGNYMHEEDFSKRPLSKLTKDIAQELGMIDDDILNKI